MLPELWGLTSGRRRDKPERGRSSETSDLRGKGVWWSQPGRTSERTGSAQEMLPPWEAPSHMGVSVPAPAALNAISVVATHSRQVSVYHVKGKMGAYRFICKLGIPSVSVGPQLPRETNNEQKDNTLLYCRTPTAGVTFPLL